MNPFDTILKTIQADDSNFVLSCGYSLSDSAVKEAMRLASVDERKKVDYALAVLKDIRELVVVASINANVKGELKAINSMINRIQSYCSDDQPIVASKKTESRLSDQNLVEVYLDKTYGLTIMDIGYTDLDKDSLTIQEIETIATKLGLEKISTSHIAKHFYGTN